MNRRLFIAINLPENIKDKIQEILKASPAYYDDHIMFAKPENWHLTVSFLGYQPEEAINKIIESIKDTAKKFQNPLIEFEKIIWGPLNKPPRMLWMLGSIESAKKMEDIKNVVENNLKKNNIRFEKEERRFNCHLTLARFKTGKVKTSEIELPKIEKMAFNANSLDLIESHLNRSGAKYENLLAVKFNQ
ncbi:2'-5' RNA ligase [Candidatus Wolfebacteria bacterium RIFCSPLOWO2_01_FULL_38_11]|uniref:RNA 2',3'-cyclic phosphodiesterase n=2 Tax=Candidatus Wolfeibacteriota TaxID=1752735 RepID=A0A0G0FW33_9BACT|nr:MAG: 2',5' RNA ligase, 2'-5' RNA ligase [Candidatus Wolfebacteria bacterium GW2011_GWC1_37_10]OGM91411.1 MAG: 2'-5' RNA ligase [Candidatus Wolfebacteria bacterium RIFCSPLOWO2_01_FULL_38_11]